MAESVLSQRAAEKHKTSTSRKKLEILSPAQFGCRYPSLKISSSSVDAPTKPLSPSDFYTAQTREIVALITDRMSLSAERVALVSDVVFDVTEPSPPLETAAPVVASASSAPHGYTPEVVDASAPLRRTLR